jgi:uncharacterized protein (TIGR03435 family)
MAGARSVLILAFALLQLLGSARTATQTDTTSDQAFEVASVRPNTSGGDNLFSRVETRPGGSVEAINVPLRLLIHFAYGLNDYETIEGPSSRLNDRFDVRAKAAQDVPMARWGEVGPLNLMMQELLAERFKLVVQWEDRPQPGYALVRLRDEGSLGPRIRPSDRDCSDPVARKQTLAQKPGACGFSVMNNELKAMDRSMAGLAQILFALMRKPVIDRTGVVGSFDVEMTFDQLEFAPAQFRRPTEPSGAPSLFRAIQEQLGLELEPQQIPVRVLIVEHVESPSEN